MASVPGRLAYLGLRYVHHWGSTQDKQFQGSTVQVQATSSVLTADLGVDIPVGAAELVAGISLGATRYQQTGKAFGAIVDTLTGIGWEFTAAPALSMYFRVGRILVAPEVSWSLAGYPTGFDMISSHRGPLFYLKLVVPFEVDRIRQ